MLALAFLKWWYGPGWFWSVKVIGVRLNDYIESFSIPILLKTLFAPWKQIIAQTGPNSTLNSKFRALIDNLVSRFVGFWVRLFVLIAGGLIMGFVAVFGLLFIVIWPVIPWIPLMLVIVSIIGA